MYILSFHIIIQTSEIMWWDEYHVFMYSKFYALIFPKSKSVVSQVNAHYLFTLHKTYMASYPYVKYIRLWLFCSVYKNDEVLSAFSIREKNVKLFHLYFHYPLHTSMNCYILEFEFQSRKFTSCSISFVCNVTKLLQCLWRCVLLQHIHCTLNERLDNNDDGDKQRNYNCSYPTLLVV